MPPFDEQEVRIKTSGMQLADAIATRDKEASSRKAADAVFGGAGIEVEQSQQRMGRFSDQAQRRAREAREERAAISSKLYKSSSKMNLTEACQSYAIHDLEQRVLADVIQLAQRDIDDARGRARLAEVSYMKSDLAYQEACVIVLAIEHEAAAAHLVKTDPSFEELPYGPKISEALDNIANLTVRIAEKERGQA